MLTAAPAGAALATTIYCCTDPGGRRVCGDVLPASCYSTSYREISPQGVVRREVARPLTAEEVARLKEEEALRQEREERQRKQRQLDSALLQTYTSVDDLDARRQRALDGIERALAELREREAATQARRDELQRERAGKQAPAAALENELRSADGELGRLREALAAKSRERDALRAKFDEERRRYLELTGPADARP